MEKQENSGLGYDNDIDSKQVRETESQKSPTPTNVDDQFNPPEVNWLGFKAYGRSKSAFAKRFLGLGIESRGASMVVCFLFS